ncbi:MAG: hypothetical protein IJB26_02440 [Clostridia bacterium]|nr:hypothetical protein [Clostridia bacterium]
MNARSGSRIAFCGVAAALSTVILLMTAVPITEISLAALAGIVGIPVVIEVGKKYGVLVYAAVSVLALLLVPTLEGKGLYIAFFGYYPVLKAALEGRRLHRALEWGIKFAVFNAAVIAAYWLMLAVFRLEKDTFVIGGVSLPWVFLPLGNGVFWLYDRCLSGLIGKYLALWQPRVQRLFKL